MVLRSTAIPNSCEDPPGAETPVAFLMLVSGHDPPFSIQSFFCLSKDLNAELHVIL